jgi:hypothetical protein
MLLIYKSSSSKKRTKKSKTKRTKRTKRTKNHRYLPKNRSHVSTYHIRKTPYGFSLKHYKTKHKHLRHIKKQHSIGIHKLKNGQRKQFIKKNSNTKTFMSPVIYPNPKNEIHLPNKYSSAKKTVKKPIKKSSKKLEKDLSKIIENVKLIQNKENVKNAKNNLSQCIKSSCDPTSTDYKNCQNKNCSGEIEKYKSEFAKEYAKLN